jgi:hypothetical protein
MRVRGLMTDAAKHFGNHVFGLTGEAGRPIHRRHVPIVLIALGLDLPQIMRSGNLP